MEQFRGLKVWTILVTFIMTTYNIMAAPDNRGSEFIIAFMESQRHGTAPSLSPELYVTTMETTKVNVEVRAPIYSSTTINETFSVTTGEVKKLSFPSDIRVTGTNLNKKGIWVMADNEIIIYGFNTEKNSIEGFLGLPTDVLGTEYFVITWYPANMQCQLLVVGVNDSTIVNIRLSQALGNSSVTWNRIKYYKGDNITVGIDRYETLQLTSKGDLTGSYITSNKIVSVFSGNKRTKIDTNRGSDHLVEQWPPISTYGKTFATVPIPRKTIGDIFKLVASEENTIVNITGGNHFTSIKLKTSGSFAVEDIPSGPGYYCYIESDKPILVAQFSKGPIAHSSSDKSHPMMTMIIPNELFAADYTFVALDYSGSQSYTNYLMFVVKDSEKSDLIIDGSSFPASTVYNSIPGTGFVGGYITVSEGTHTIHHNSTISLFGGYLYGTVDKATYGFPIGSRFTPINTVCVPSQNIVDDGKDNDCDGHIDEELCNNGKDDDGDGNTDEDCALTFPSIDNTTNQKWHASTVLQDYSLSTGTPDNHVSTSILEKNVSTTHPLNQISTMSTENQESTEPQKNQESTMSSDNYLSTLTTEKYISTTENHVSTILPENQVSNLSPDNKQSTCMCSCDDMLNATQRQNQVESDMVKIISELTVDKKSLSSAIRRKRCSDDNRPTAKSIGYVGIIILCIVLGGIVVPDIWTLLLYLKRSLGRNYGIK